MYLQAFGLLLLTTAVPLVTSAITDAVCTDPFQTWVFNSKGEDPCLVAEKLAGVCISSGLALPLLTPDTVYFGPTADQDNECQCSTVFYSLVSACAACQDRGWIPFDLFVTNCSQVWAGTGIDASAYNIQIPSYAFLNIHTGSTFNETAAIDAAAASSTATLTSSVIPKTSNDKSSHKGALIGGVIGSVALIATMGVLVWMFIRRRRRPIALPTSRSSKHYIQLSESGTDWTTAPKPVYQPKKHDSHAIDAVPFKE